MEQYIIPTTNFKVGDISLGEGRTESTIFPMGDCESCVKLPVMEGDQKVGDHHEYA